MTLTEDSGEGRPTEDMDVALRLIYHIRRPCTAQIGDTTVDIGEFYRGEAERVLPTLRNPVATSILQAEIDCYNFSPPENP